MQQELRFCGTDLKKEDFQPGAEIRIFGEFQKPEDPVITVTGEVIDLGELLFSAAHNNTNWAGTFVPDTGDVHLVRELEPCLWGV